MIPEWILTVLLLTTKTGLMSHYNPCNGRTFTNTHGIIRENVFFKEWNNFNCTWIIQQNSEVITTIRILELAFKHCNRPGCCVSDYLLVGQPSKTYRRFCSITSSKWISLQESYTEIILVSQHTPAKLWLEYSSRPISECQHYEFQCLDKSNCYNTSDICDGTYDCLDHSDEINCRNCDKHLAPCNNWTTICFDPVNQRCNEILDCPLAEDEVSCTNKCPHNIKCYEQNHCIETDQVCDKTPDCLFDYDEINCERQFCVSSKYFLCNNGACINKSLVKNGLDDCGDASDETDNFNIFITGGIMIIILLFTCAFAALILRWCLFRRDIERLLQNLPEFPLPPFQGPGEYDYNSFELEYSDSDFRAGGEIFEAFARTRRQLERSKRTSRRERSTTYTSGDSDSTYSIHPDGDEEVEMIRALIALGISPTMCIGLDDRFINHEFIISCMKLQGRKKSNEIDLRDTFYDKNLNNATLIQVE